MLAAVGLLFFLGVFTLAPIAWATVGAPWAPLAFAFAVIPLLDAALGRARGNVFAGASAALVRWVPRAHLLFQALLLVGAIRLAPALDVGALVLFALAVGTITGGIGITVAHELGHRRSRLDRAIARTLLASVCYGHFLVEHIRGHHVRVATADDPASAPQGMNVYRFIVRSVIGGLAHAWRLEALRLRSTARRAWSPRNAVLSGLLASAALAALAYGAGSLHGLGLFVLQSVWAVVLLEIINYIEHYGLRRRKIGGRYEPVAAHHSWNADFAVSNWLLFNLQLHSDHHARAGRPYERLRTQPQAPQLPAGYPAMVLAALLPPLWFRLIDPRLPAAPAAA